MGELEVSASGRQASAYLQRRVRHFCDCNFDLCEQWDFTNVIKDGGGDTLRALNSPVEVGADSSPRKIEGGAGG